MTKDAWIRHIEEASGLPRLETLTDDTIHGTGTAYADYRRTFQDTVAWHKQTGCKACKDRRRTYTASLNRKAREDAYRSAGLVKVRGAVTGRIYWE